MKWAVVAMLTVVSSGSMAQNALKPVNGDSVMLEDFFWLDKVDSARALFPTLKPQGMAVTAREEESLAKCVERFGKLEPRLSVTGCEKGQKGEAKRFKSARDVALQSFKLALMTRQGKYFDYCEQALFNEIAGAWTDSAAKKTKDLAEVLMAIPQMVYAVDGKDVYINMLVRNKAHIVAEGLDLTVSTMASMPWYSQLNLYLEMEQDQEFTLHIRMPLWAEGKSVMSSYGVKAVGGKTDIYINGERPEKTVADGYCVVSRLWKNGDMIKINLPSPVIRIQDPQHPAEIALQRGPLVFAF